jgi:hypothetical protein
MPHVIEWFLAGLLVLFGVLGSSETVDAPPPVGVAAPGTMSPGAMQRDEAAEMSALDLLAYIPDTPETRQWLTVGDPEAWHRTTGVPRISSIEETRTMTEEAHQSWVYALPAETLPPNALGMNYLAVDDLRAIIGLSYYEALQYVEAGSPPDLVAIVTAQVSPPEVANALLASGYTATAAEGATLYAKNDDYAIDLTNPARSAALGALNRIAVLDAPLDAASTTVIIGRASAPVEDALAASSDNASLADDTVYKAIQHALAENAPAIPGELVGALFLGVMPAMDVGAMLTSTPEEARAMFEERIALLEADPLSPWLTTALVTHRDGDDVYMSALVALPPSENAESLAAANAESLANRMANWESAAARRPFADYWEPWQSTGFAVDDLPLAWVTMKLMPDVAGNFGWTRLIFQRDDLFLVPAGTP